MSTRGAIVPISASRCEVREGNTYLLLSKVTGSTEDCKDDRLATDGDAFAMSKRACSPMKMVLSLSSSWDVSIDGMVPDIDLSRGILVGVGWDESKGKGWASKQRVVWL
jgi:hypothetical protein